MTGFRVGRVPPALAFAIAIQGMAITGPSFALSSARTVCVAVGVVVCAAVGPGLEPQWRRVPDVGTPAGQVVNEPAATNLVRVVEISVVAAGVGLSRR